MPAFTEEIFGPVAPITTFASDEEAIELVNRSEYGLSAAISTSIRRARSRSRASSRREWCTSTTRRSTTSPTARSRLRHLGQWRALRLPGRMDEFTQWQWSTLRDKQRGYPF